MKKSVAALVVVAIAVAGLTGIATAQSTASSKNIVQTAVAAGQFKTLVSLVKQAGLAGALSAPGQLTVFAPTDAAFAKVPKATSAALGKDKALLKSVLLYHVAKGKLTAAKVVKLKSVKTLQGGVLAIRANPSPNEPNIQDGTRRTVVVRRTATASVESARARLAVPGRS